MALIDSLLQRVKNRRLVMTLAPIVIGGFLGVVLVVKPSMSKIAQLQAQKSELSQKSSALNEIIAWEKNFDESAARLASMEDRAKTIEDLTSSASASGLNISSVVPDEKRPFGSYLDTILVRIEAEGNYHQLADFISGVESRQPFVKVLSVNINTGIGEDSGDADERVAATGPKRSTNKAEGSYKISIGLGLFYAQKGVV